LFRPFYFYKKEVRRLNNKNFRYVIQTELNLAPGALNKLLGQVRELNSKIESQKTFVYLNARLAPNARESIQKQVEAIKATVKINLDIDNASILSAQKKIEKITQQLALVRGASSTAGATTQQPVAGTSRRVGSGIPSAQELARLEQEAKIHNLNALAIKRQAQAENESARASLARARAVELSNKAQIQAVNLANAQARLDAALARKNSTEQRAALSDTKVRLREQELNLRQQRLNQQASRVGSGGSQSNANNTLGGKLEQSLVDPSLSVEQRRKNFEQLRNAYKEYAVREQVNVPKTFAVYDPLIGKVKLATREFTAQGKEIDRADRSFGHLAETMGKNIVFYSAASMGFYAISSAISTSIKQMADFESQFLRIKTITTSSEATQAQNTIFDLGKRYGLDPTQQIAPIMSSVLRQTDVIKGGPTGNRVDQAKMITQLIVRAARADQGGNVNPQDLDSISKDFMSIYRAGTQNGDNSFWASRGQNPTKQMSDLIDFMALMNQKKNVKISTNLDAVSTLMPLAINRNLDPKMLSAMVGSIQTTNQDGSGAEAATNIKLYLEQLYDANSTGGKFTRRALGLKPNAELNDVLSSISEQVKSGKLNENQKGAIASNLSEHGNARNAAFMNIINSAPLATELANSVNYIGLAEKNAAMNANTLSGKWDSLLAVLQKLTNTLSKGGLSDALKGIITVMTQFVTIVNSIMEGIQNIGNLTKHIFGDQMGGALNSAIAQLILLTAAIKGAGLAYKMFFGADAKFSFNPLQMIGITKKSNPVAGIGSELVSAGVAGTTALDLVSMHKNRQKQLGASIVERQLVDPNGILTGYYPGMGGRRPPRRAYASMNSVDLTDRWRIGSRGANIERGVLEASGSRVSSVGSTVGSFILNAAGLKGMFGGGASGGAGKIADVFSKVLFPALTRFGLLLTRLSIWGAALFAVFKIGQAIYNHIEDQKNAVASSVGNALSPENLPKTLADMQTVGQAVKAGKNDFTPASQGYRGLASASKIGFAEGTTERDAFERLKASKFTPKGHGVFEFSAPGITGDRQDNLTVDTSSAESLKNIPLLAQAIGNGTGILNQQWKNTIGLAHDYSTVLEDIRLVTEKVADSTRFINLASGLTNIKFLGGGEGSTASYGEQISNLMTSAKVNTSQFKNIVTQSNSIEAGRGNSDQILADAESAIKNLDIKGGSKGADIYKEVFDAFSQAKQSGTLDEAAKLYDTRNINYQKNDPNLQLKSNLMLGLVNRDKEQTSLQEGKKQIEDLTGTITNQAQSLKELAISYTIASSGINIFDSVLKQVQSDVGQAQHQLSMALSVPDKINANKAVFGETAKEARLYKEQLNSVQAKIAEIKKNSSDDFSTNALYNPGPNGLSIDQASVKQMTEQTFEIKSNLNQTVEALHSQVDAIAELVFSTQKYSYIWDSVNKRIELGKQLSGELRDIQTSIGVNQKVGQLHTALEGNNFDVGGFNRDNALKRRDSAVDIYSRTQYAMATYKDDSKKLGEALNEITGGTKSISQQLNDAFLSPLSDLVKTDFQSAGAKQLEAATGMKDAIAELDKLLASYQAKMETLMGAPAATDAPIGGSGILSGALPSSYAKRDTTGGYYQPSSSATTGSISSSSGKIDSLLTEAVKLQDTGKFKYNQVPGEFQGTYGQFVQSAISDCSQFVQEMFKQFLGVKLPRTAAEQWNKGQSVGQKDIQKGDLVFFNTTGKEHSHVGISMGGSKFINMGNDGIQTSDLNSKYWSPKFEGARRLPGIPSGMPDLPNIQPSASALVGQGAEAMKAITLADQIARNRTSIQAQVDYFKPEDVKSSIVFQRTKAAQTADVDASVSGSRVDSLLGKADARKEAVRTVASTIAAAQSTLQGLNNDQKTAPKELIPFYKQMIDKLQGNIKSLDAFREQLIKDMNKDPRNNGKVALDEINKELSNMDSLRKQGKEGGVEWYQSVANLNRMNSEFMTRKKMTQGQQDNFDNFGANFDRLILSKIIGFNEDVALTVRKLASVQQALKGMTEGTNAWHLALEDSVAAQQHILDLENRKTEIAQKNFELTGTGLKAYINDRGYQQGRDITRANTNLGTAVDNYKNNPSSNYTENLVNLQVIGDMYQKVQSQIQEYRNAVTESFKAGILSVADYIKKLQELRNVQEESKQQAIDMTDSINNTFHSSLADSLKSAFEGSFTAPLDFQKNIKSGIASAISNQLSTTLLTQSGLMDNVNSMIAQMVTAFTKGPTSANAFNVEDFQKMMNDSINPMMPFITAIADSTKGMFAIMNDQVFNAPGGFKVDSYLYGFQKQMSYDDWVKKYGSVGNWGSGTPTNEAGSPFPTPGTGVPIVLPPTTTPIGTGIGQILNNPPTPIESVTAGVAMPDAVTGIRNPVKELLNDIVSMQQIYKTNNPLATNYNSTVHGAANQARELLGQLAPEVLKKIGNGVNIGSMNDKQILDLLRSSDLSQYDMVTGIGGVSSGIDSMSMGLINKLDQVNSSINGVASVLGASKNTGGTSTSGTPSSPTGSGGSPSPSPTTSVPSTVNVGGQVLTPSQVSSGMADAYRQIYEATHPSSSTGSSSSSSSNPYQSYAEQYKQTHTTSMSSDQLANYFNNLNKSGSSLPGMPHYHTGGLAGIMNFANADSLKPNEVKAVLMRGEPVFSGGQLGSLMDNISSGGGSSGGKLDINVNLNGNATGVPDETIIQAIREGVAQGISEMQRQDRLSNLRNRGVSYGN
jgi:cell wall-associated NlpC family hydrolase